MHKSLEIGLLLHFARPGNKKLFYTISLILLFSLIDLLQNVSSAAADQTSIPSTGNTALQVGLTERLGDKIPLDLVFRDEKGKQIRLSNLITGPTIILPVYYNCTNVCNFLQAGMASALSGVKRKPGEEYRILSISFDETETPALASRYKKMYLESMNTPFPEDGWRFLTGDIANIHRFTDAIGYRFLRQGEMFVHPVASMVVTKDGTIVRYFYSTTFLPKDLTLALLEAQDGKVGATIRTVVGYCFSFDPKGKTYVFNLMRVSATIVILCAGTFLLFLIFSGRKTKYPPQRNKP